MSVFRKFTDRRKSSQINGYASGTNSSTVNAMSKQINGSTGLSKQKTLPPSEDCSELQDSTITRETVSDTFAEYAQLIHASQRPLPNQSGDGQ